VRRERVLTQNELNRALLARQLLLGRTRLSIPRAVERVAGIQNQYAPNAYIRLWSCLDGFRRDDLTRALERRSVVQATVMRGTIHIVSPRDFWLFQAGIRRAGLDWWQRVHRPHAQATDLAGAGRALRCHLRGRVAEREELTELLRSFDPPDAPRNLAWSGVDVPLVRVPPSGTWARRRAHTFALADEWIAPGDVTEGAGLEHLARRYLAGFGPAGRADLASWASVPVTALAPVLDRMTLRRFRDEDGRELLDLPRAPIPAGDTKAPVRFLPTWDATLLVHARRTQILPEEYRPLVFTTKNPASVWTFLVDGRVAGTWRYAEPRIELEPFAPLPRVARRELEDEASRLAAFHA
jgi:winged helix DNA-binding protein